jgi:hypothetical protein
MKDKKINFKDHTLLKALKKWILEMQDNLSEIGHETALAKELLFYIPIGTALIFFYFTNNLSFMYHSFGNYGFEEGFLSNTIPLVKAFSHGDFSGARLGLQGALYPALLATYIDLFGGDILRGALFLNVLFGTSSLLLFFYLLHRLAGAATALICIVLLAANPLFFEFTYTASFAPTLIFLFLLSSLLFLRSMAGGNIAIILAALFSALACLINLSALILPITAIAILFRGKNSKHLMFYVLAFLAIIIPSVLFISSKTTTIFETIPFITISGNYALAFSKNLYFRLFALVGDLTGWILGIFSLAGLIILFLTKEEKKVYVWYLCGGVLFIFSTLITYDRHFIVILLLFILPLTVRPFVTGAIGRLLDKRATLPVLAIFIIFTAIHLFISIDKNGKTAKGEPRHLIPMAEYIRANIKEKGTILSVRSLFPVRLGFKHVPFDKQIEEWSALLEYAKEKKCDYLLADFPEYNIMPFMRFLANEEVTAPKGAVQISRSGMSALYKFTFENTLDSTTLQKGYGISEVLTAYSFVSGEKLERDSIAQFIRSRIKKGVPEEITPPQFQVVTQNQGNGFMRYGFVFKSSRGALVSANLTTPPTGNLKVTDKPGILLLPGLEKEGKANALAKNVAENLAKAGAYVLTIDQPGTGERTGIQYSHSAMLMYSTASGYAPAEPFILEAMEAAALLPNFTGMQTDSFSVVSIGEDCWTALYLSILNKKIKNVAFMGGLAPYLEMAVNGGRPIQAVIPSIASKTDLPTLISAIVTPKRHFISFNADSFVVKTFTPFINSFCTEINLTAPEISFTYIKEEAVNQTATIGADQISANTPLLFDYPVNERFDSLSGGIIKVESPVAGAKEVVLDLFSVFNVFTKYSDNINSFYDAVITGNKSSELLTRQITSQIYLVAMDTISAYAALYLAAQNRSFVTSISLPMLVEERPSRLLTGSLTGYDGSMYSTANMENVNNLLLCRFIYIFGNFDPAQYLADADGSGSEKP